MENAPKDTNVTTGTRAPVTIGKKANVLERTASLPIVKRKKEAQRPVHTSPRKR